MKSRLPLPPFLPDQSANSGSLDTANNVYPKTDGYGPISQFSSFSAQLSAAFRGGASFIALDGTSYLFVGTAAGVVKYAGGSWTDVFTGMTVTGHWRFAQFGNYVVCVNGVETKVIDLATGTGSVLTDAPAGITVGIVGDYVVICQASSDLLGVFTSGFNDHTDWDYVASTATYQPMLTGGEVMGLAGGEYGVILQRQRLVRMSRTGDATAPFTYDDISTNVGCASKGSVAQYGNRVFFLSDAGFKCLVAGQEPVQNIGSEKVDRTFISEVPRDDWERIFTAIDPQSKVVVWCVPNSKLWIYNWELDRWTTATPNAEGVFSGFTTSTDLETLAVTYPDLDAMTISLDSPRWSGGSPRLYAVQSQEVGTFYGDRLEATFEYSFNELSPGRVARVRTIRPVTDATDGHTITLDCRARLGDAENIKTASAIRTSGIMPVRGSGRYIRPRWTIAAATSWSYAQGLDLELEAGGER